VRGGVGESLALGDIELVVHAIQDPAAPGGRPPPTGTRTIAADVEVRHVGTGPSLNYSVSKWRAFDGEGFAFEAESLRDDPQRPSLIEGVLAPGGNVRGWIAFTVPTDARLARVEYISGYLSGDVFSITP
jgi:hypothetical protein